MRQLITATHATSLSSPHPTVVTPPAVAPPSSRPVVILPGLGNNTVDYEGLAAALKSRGVPSVVVARVSRLDWLRNAAGLLDPNYWRGTLCPRRCSTDGDFSLIGHSAGGWLARLYMEEFGCSDASLLLTLGTPHLPPPKGLPGIVDQTRGLLDYVERNCPPAVYSPERKYVCIAGRYIKGVSLIGSSSSSEGPEEETPDGAGNGSETGSPGMNGRPPPPAASTLSARFVGQGYKQVCGRADVWGTDVPLPFGSDETRRPWYGTPAVLDQWFHHLLV
ncbi:unnamed protein product [Spirodela intermedia]|uniref:Uncharacterized protein n=1 Tax=Spirodela intermedia TaxID=51605 RepID=A0A7I8JIC0_SPIIN|nr:unnamed protein product [Spirodela intermedia]CAA6669485.1 unnamed protein product [Spirodela intermedia]